MVMRGRRKWIPFELIKEIEEVRVTDSCVSFADACRRVGKEYSPTGREIKRLTTGKLLKNIFLGVEKK